MISDNQTGEEGVYRGTEIRSEISEEFGAEVLEKVEAWLEEAVREALK